MKKSKVFLLTQTVALPKIDTLFWTTLYFILGGFVRQSVGSISIISCPNIPFSNQNYSPCYKCAQLSFSC